MAVPTIPQNTPVSQFQISQSEQNSHNNLEQVIRSFRECFLIGSFTFSFLLFLAILNKPVCAFGTWLSPIALKDFGWVSYLMPFIFAFFVLKIYNQWGRDFNLIFLLVNLLGALLLSCGFSGMASLIFGIGGIFGRYLSDQLYTLLGPIGSVLVLASAVSIGFSLTTKTSLIGWVARLRLHFGQRNPTVNKEMFSSFLPKNVSQRGAAEEGAHNAIYCDQFIHNEKSKLLEKCLRDFDLSISVVNFQQGPLVTRYELSLMPGVKASRISALQNDIARYLSVESVRILEIIPGRPFVGIEIPNAVREMVYFEQLKDHSLYKEAHQLPLIIGRNVIGDPIAIDLAELPHLLIGGTTGSGKSSIMNTMIISLINKLSPKFLQFILIDPKRVDFSALGEAPHLISPVITDIEQAETALKWCVSEMERRYQHFQKIGSINTHGTAEFPRIVIVIDELDALIDPGSDIETMIIDLAKRSRACGMHLILGTQRPSADIITPHIKANIASRISLKVASQYDSRIILDSNGAEQLLGHGDMLIRGIPGLLDLERVHGAFVEENSIRQIIEQSKRLYPVKSSLLNFSDSPRLKSYKDADEYLEEAIDYVNETGKISASSIQRKFCIGYNRASRIVDEMERRGIVGAKIKKNGHREVLVASEN